jgi:hypothetical protein
MNPPKIPSSTPRNWLLPVLAFTFALGLLFFGLIVYGITSYVRLGSDERALRNGLLKTADAPFVTKLEVNVGSCTVAVARTGLLFAHLERRARTALDCVRAGEVGIYQFKERDCRMDRSAMLAAADKVMDRRGWDRLVGVVNPRDFVAVYIQRKSFSASNLKVCVAVVDDGRLIVASARSNVEPLIEMIREQPQWREHRGLPIQLSAMFQ